MKAVTVHQINHLLMRKIFKKKQEKKKTGKEKKQSQIMFIKC